MFVDFVASIFLFGGPLVREVIEDSLSIPLTFRVTISVDLTIHFASSGSAVGKLFYYLAQMHNSTYSICTNFSACVLTISTKNSLHILVKFYTSLYSFSHIYT